MKRVVTGFNGDGASIFVSQDEPATTYENTGIKWTEIWSSYPHDLLPIDPNSGPKREAVNDSVFPSKGKTIFRVLEFAPNLIDPATLNETELAEMNKVLPGLASHMEPGNPGMHTTDSIDYGVILSGKIKMELDDGQTAELCPGDVWIQNGTRHAWRVEEKCLMAVVLVGVDRCT